MRTMTIRAAGAIGIACAVGFGAVSYGATSGNDSMTFVGNDVVNSSAAVDLSAWRASSAASPVNLSRVAASVPSGSTTAIDVVTSESTGDWGEILGDLKDPAFIKAGNTYRMSVWVRSVDGNGTYLGVLLANANYQNRPSDDSVYTGFRDTKWHKISKTFVATSDASADTAFYIGLTPQATAHFQFSDASVSVLAPNTASPAAPPAAVASGTQAKPVTAPTTASAAPSMSAPAPVVTTSAPAPAAPTSAPATGQTTSGSVPGFNLVFNDDFNTNAAAGQFLNAYGSKWGAYDGFRDTGGVGQYNSNILSVSGGVLDMYLHTENGVPQVAAPVPFINGGWGGQKYGRYSVRFRADSVAGYKTAWLLWPDSNNWSEGEIDFPEGDLNGTIYAFNHQVGNPANNALAVNTGATFSAWHTATTEWTPAGVKFYLDGNVVGSSSVSPSAPMHMVLQTETAGYPAGSTTGHVQIDSVSIWSYNG